MPLRKRPAASSKAEVGSRSEKEAAALSAEEGLPSYSESQAAVPASNQAVQPTNQAASSSSHSVGLRASNISTEATSFKLFRRSKHGRRGDYTVVDSGDSKYLQSGFRTWSYKRDLLDANGTPMYKLEMNKWRLPVVYYMDDVNGNRVVEMKGKWSWAKLKADLRFKNLNGQDIVLNFRASSWNNNRFDVTLGERNLAYIVKGDWDRHMYKEQGASQSYDINVSANMDHVLMCALVMALDECVILMDTSSGSSIAASAGGAAAGAGA